jgi:nitroreductase
MVLQATALGLHTHGMAGLDKDKARTSLEIPEAFEIGAVWALGYLGDPTTLPAGLQESETAPRTRNPLSDFVFEAWQEPAKL